MAVLYGYAVAIAARSCRWQLVICFGVPLVVVAVYGEMIYRGNSLAVLQWSHLDPNLEQAMEPTGYAVVFAVIIVKYRLLSLRAAIRKAAVVSRVIISII